MSKYRSNRLVKRRRHLDPHANPHTIGLPSGKNEILVRYRGNGGEVGMAPHAAAVAVIRREADVIDGPGGNKIPSEKAVICQRTCGPASAMAPRKVGMPVEVIDAGNGSYVLIGSTAAAPLVMKEQCRPVAMCEDAKAECGACCNNRFRK